MRRADQVDDRRIARNGVSEARGIECVADDRVRPRGYFLLGSCASQREHDVLARDEHLHERLADVAGSAGDEHRRRGHPPSLAMADSFQSTPEPLTPEISVLPSRIDERLAHHDVPPVRVFEPMRGRGDREQLRADLGPQMVGDAQTARGGDGAGAKPAGDAADLHHVRHHIVRSVRIDRVLEVERAPPVLAALDRGPRLSRDLRVTCVVVRERRLLDPGEVELVEHAHALHRFNGGERLVEVDHDRNIGPDGLAHGANHRDILGHRRIPDLGLDAREAAPGPILRNAGGLRDAVVAHGAVGRHRIFRRHPGAGSARRRAGARGRPRAPCRSRPAPSRPGLATPAGESGARASARFPRAPARRP